MYLSHERKSKIKIWLLLSFMYLLKLVLDALNIDVVFESLVMSIGKLRKKLFSTLWAILEVELLDFV